MPVIKLATSEDGLDGPEVVADLFGPFAVHPTWHGEPGQFHLTHVATGYAFLERVRYDEAVAAANEINASGIDWSGVRHGSMTPAHKKQGRAMRAKYPGDPVVHRQHRD